MNDDIVRAIEGGGATGATHPQKLFRWFTLRWNVSLEFPSNSFGMSPHRMTMTKEAEYSEMIKNDDGKVVEV